MVVEVISRIPEKICRRGARYNFLNRGAKTLMYERVSNGVTTSIEVFRIKIRKSVKIKGQYIKASERFPHDEAFGDWAWCFTSIEKAMAKFEQIEKN